MLGSLDPILEDPDSAAPRVGYHVGEETVYVQCCLKPSGFARRTFNATNTRDNWTNHQRGKATGVNVHYLQSADHLTTYVSKSLCLLPLVPFLLSGWSQLQHLPLLGKHENMIYYRISPEFEHGCVYEILIQELFNWSGFRKSIQVTGAGGELLFSVVRCMPDQLRERITEVIEAAYPHDWKYTAAGEVERGGFQADHFCLWNRYCENVRSFVASVCLYSSHHSF